MNKQYAMPLNEHVLCLPQDWKTWRYLGKQEEVTNPHGGHRSPPYLVLICKGTCWTNHLYVHWLTYISINQCFEFQKRWGRTTCHSLFYTPTHEAVCRGQIQRAVFVCALNKYYTIFPDIDGIVVLDKNSLYLILLSPIDHLMPSHRAWCWNSFVLLASHSGIITWHMTDDTCIRPPIDNISHPFNTITD